MISRTALVSWQGQRKTRIRLIIPLWTFPYSDGFSPRELDCALALLHSDVGTSRAPWSLWYPVTARRDIRALMGGRMERRGRTIPALHYLAPPAERVAESLRCDDWVIVSGRLR